MPTRTAGASVEINAPIEVVWRVVTRFADYARWNPFIVEARAEGGDARVGQTVDLQVRWVGGGGTTATQRVTRVDAPRVDPTRVEAGDLYTATFEYTFTGWPARLGLVRATRTQRLTQRRGADVTTWASSERFSGPLVGAIPLTRVQAGFDAHAQALKRACEDGGW